MQRKVISCLKAQFFALVNEAEDLGSTTRKRKKKKKSIYKQYC